MRPETLLSNIVYSGYFDLRKDLLKRQDGATTDYTSIILGWDAVVVIAEDLEGRLIVNREYRHAVGKTVLCCPGGKIEKGEDPLLGAKRELLEETGYSSKELTIIGSCYPLPGLCNQKIYYVYAKNSAFESPQQLDPFEFIETELMTEEALKNAIQAGESVDGILCTALFYKSHLADLHDRI